MSDHVAYLQKTNLLLKLQWAWRFGTLRGEMMINIGKLGKMALQLSMENRFEETAISLLCAWNQGAHDKEVTDGVGGNSVSQDCLAPLWSAACQQIET